MYKFLFYSREKCQTVLMNQQKNYVYMPMSKDIIQGSLYNREPYI